MQSRIYFKAGQWLTSVELLGGYKKLWYKPHAIYLYTYGFCASMRAGM